MQTTPLPNFPMQSSTMRKASGRSCTAPSGPTAARCSPLCHIQARQHHRKDVKVALPRGLLGDTAPLQQHGLQRAEMGISGSPHSPAHRAWCGHTGSRQQHPQMGRYHQELGRDWDLPAGTWMALVPGTLSSVGSSALGVPGGERR